MKADISWPEKLVIHHVLLLLHYLFDFQDLLDQIIDDKEEEDNLEAQHQVVRPIDIAKQLHRVEAEVFWVISLNDIYKDELAHTKEVDFVFVIVIVFVLVELSAQQKITSASE